MNGMKAANQIGQALDRATLGGQQCVNGAREPMVKQAMGGLHYAIEQQKQLIRELYERLKPVMTLTPEQPCKVSDEKAGPELVRGIYLLTEDVNKMSEQLRDMVVNLEV